MTTGRDVWAGEWDKVGAEIVEKVQKREGAGREEGREWNKMSQWWGIGGA